MALSQYCSNILYDSEFDTSYDFTMSFEFLIDTEGFEPTSLYGFSIFFIDGSTSSLNGGGCYEGLGVVDPSGSSEVDGIFLTLGFDYNGGFTAANSVAAFTTGTPSPLNNSICLRVQCPTVTNFLYISSIQYFDLPIFTIQNSNQTIRIGARNNLQILDVYYKNSNNVYEKLASFNTNLSAIPQYAKCGIGSSGDVLFKVKNITFNYT